MRKKSENMFTRVDVIHEHDRHSDEEIDRWTDRQTDGQTLHDGIGSRIASPGKNRINTKTNAL